MRKILLCLVCPLLAAAQNGAAPQQHPQQRKDTVVVTGTYEPVPLGEADRDISVLDLPSRERILFGSIADLLRLDSSIDLGERVPGGVQSDISIRGGAFGQTLVLLNGFRLNDPQTGHHNMDIPVPLDAISSVEILKGSGSAQYGSDAVDGVVNIVVRPPASPELRLRAGVGNFGTNQQSGSLAFGGAAASEELSFARDFSTGFRPDRDYRNLSLASLTHFTSRLGNSDVLLASTDRPFGADQFYGDFPSWERTREWFASLRQELGSRMETEFAYRRHTDLFVLFRDDPQIYTNRHADETWQAAFRRHDPLAPNTSVFYGAEGYRDTIASNNLGDHHRNRGAVYAGIDFRALHRFSLSAGAREEFYSTAAARSVQTEFSPTVAGGVWLTSTLKLRASWSRAFRLPTYTDLYYIDPANIGSPDLRAEHATSYEGGLVWQPVAKLRAEATVFRRDERDGIDYVRASAAVPWRATNFDRLDFTGVEAGVNVRLEHGQAIAVNFTGLAGSTAAAVGLESKYVFNYPTQSAVASWMAPLPGGFVARTRAGVLNRRGRSPYALWDASAGWTRGVVHPFFEAANITSTSYEEIPGVVMPGRSIVGGVELLLGGVK